MGNILAAIVLLGLALMLKSFFGGLALIGVAITLYGYGLKEVPANPPSAGLLTVWGTRTSTALREGYHLLAPYFPFFLDVIVVNMTTVNQDFVSQFFCKVNEKEDGKGEMDKKDEKPESFRAGIQVSLTSAITWRPDEDRLDVFLNNKGEAGVKSILDDILPQVLRIEGTRHTFESLTAGRDKLIDAIILLLVGEDYHDLTPAEKTARRNEMKNGGKKDILGLGITIFKVNVGEPDPGESSKKDIENLAKEQFQRRGEVYEVSTEIAQAQELHKAYVGAGETRTLHDCILEIRRRKSIKEGHGQVFEIPGIEALGPVVGPIVAGVAAMAKSAGTATGTRTQSQQSDSGQAKPMRKRGAPPPKSEE
ncbi:MAG: SPFH domain-containing protein [Candidatus Moraniibacteriota bacterium]